MTLLRSRAASNAVPWRATDACLSLRIAAQKVPGGTNQLCPFCAMRMSEAHSPAPDPFYDLFGGDDLPRAASTEQLARTDRVGRGLLNDASSTDVRAPQEHGRDMHESVRGEESRFGSEQEHRCGRARRGQCSAAPVASDAA